MNKKIAGLILTLMIISLSCSTDKTQPQATPQTQNQSQPKRSVEDSTQAMVDELYKLASDDSNINVWHLNKKRALAIDNQLKTITESGQKITMLFKSGIEWLNAGNYELSISKLSEIFELIKRENLQIAPESFYKIKEVLGVAYLRKAEIENCVQNHNEYSCLMPIDKAGQHQLRDGGERAVNIFRELLQSPTPTRQTQWLYNLAHMTLGSHPDEVEAKFLLNLEMFASDVSFPRFKEIGMAAGVGVNDISGSIVMEDFNNDNYLDLMVSSYGLDDQLRYFQNDKKGSFTELTASAGLTGLWSGLNTS